MGVLTVYLDKIENLIDSDGLGKSDPYVKFHLEQDNFLLDKNYGKKESTHKRNDCSPEYGETFEWEDIPSLNNMVLWIKIYDDDIGFDDQIGDGKLDLERMGITAEPKDVELVVDKKGPKIGITSIMNPCKLMYSCCCSFFQHNATIHLKISYRE